MNYHPEALSRPVSVRQAFKDVEAAWLKSASTYIRQHGNSYVERAFLKYRGKKTDAISFKLLSWDRASYTVLKSWISYGGLGHPNGNRYLTIPEVKRIGSFPDKFQFLSDRKQILYSIGNSVPPLLMKAVAANVSYQLFGGDMLIRYPRGTPYTKILDLAWEDHLKPCIPTAPTVISTFAGAGGSSLGYSMAGFKELLAVEMDDNAVTTFKNNFPDVPVYHGDIAKLSVEQCMKMAGLSESGELSLFDSSPPCQSFSMAGKRKLDDPRNQLFREYVRLLRGLKPKAFIMENVPGLVAGKMKLLFAEIMKELADSGYAVKCKKLNAQYFYVPQSRERLIFVGVRNDLVAGMLFPVAASRPIAVRKALEGITTTNILSDQQKDLWKKMRPGQSGSQVHPKGHWFNFMKLDPDKPAPTVAKEAGNAKHCYWAKPFGLSIDGYKRISSFPDPFNFIGSYGNKKNRIGNSVPPLLVRALAINLINGLNLTVSARTP